MRGKRKFYVKRAKGDGGKSPVTSTGEQGAARTPAKHGKVNTWYSALRSKRPATTTQQGAA